MNAAVWGGWTPVKLAVIFRGTEDLNYSLRDLKKSAVELKAVIIIASGLCCTGRVGF